MNNSMKMKYDINTIVSHQYDKGACLWATPDNRLQKGAPFSKLESTLYLTELGLKSDKPVLSIQQNLSLAHLEMMEDLNYHQIVQSILVILHKHLRYYVIWDIITMNY